MMKKKFCVLSINQTGIKMYMDQINISNRRQRMLFLFYRIKNKLLSIMAESVGSQIFKKKLMMQEYLQLSLILTLI